MLSDPTVLILMYFTLPVWLLAGFRAARYISESTRR
jgi:hypothetical protein